MIFDGSLSEGMLEVVMTAFYNSIPFTTENFQSTIHRDYIMDRLFQAARGLSDEVKILAFQSIAEVGRKHYDFMESYLENIFNLTKNAAFNEENPKVGA